jgi:hypothetical protein
MNETETDVGPETTPGEEPGATPETTPGT